MELWWLKCNIKRGTWLIAGADHRFFFSISLPTLWIPKDQTGSSAWNVCDHFLWRFNKRFFFVPAPSPSSLICLILGSVIWESNISQRICTCLLCWSGLRSRLCAQSSAWGWHCSPAARMFVDAAAPCSHSGWPPRFQMLYWKGCSLTLTSQCRFHLWRQERRQEDEGRTNPHCRPRFHITACSKN